MVDSIWLNVLQVAALGAWPQEAVALEPSTVVLEPRPAGLEPPAAALEPPAAASVLPAVASVAAVDLGHLVALRAPQAALAARHSLRQEDLCGR